VKILRFLYIALFAYVALSFTLCRRAEKVQPAENLRCEHLINPLGIDCAAPRFSWRLPVSENNAVQSAYQIKVSADSLALLSGRSDVWDSFKVLSDVQSAVYKGAPLQSFTKYFWTVVYYDKFDNVSCVSPVASFETAMMSASDWQGEWISDGKSKDYKSAPYFRKKFSADKKIKSARVYIAAAGLFELSVNGAKVSEDMLNPMFTCFDRRNLYVTNDVTSFLNDGHNVIGILLGNGWYNHQSTTVWHFDKASWRNRPRFMLNLRIKFEDGTVETIATDTLWKTTDSPIVFNSIYTAEHYDARKEIPGWDKPLFNDKSWKQAVSETSPSEIIIAQQLNPIQVIDTLKPVKMTKRSDKHYVFHFDRNIAGTIKIKADGAESTILRIRHAELLDKNDLPNMSNIDYHHRPTDDSDPFQTDIFILSGTKEDVFTPRFNYKGFQYVDVVSSKPINLTKESLIALEMHSHVPQA
jgi:alpha-L-rhamnosidase